VAYKGSSAAATALAAGEVQIMFSSASTGLSFTKAGRMRMLAVASRERSLLAPDVPTMAEAGLPGYEASSMSGMFAPAKTPQAIVNRLNAEIVKALERRDVKERFQSAAIEAVGSTPHAFAAILRADMAKWGKVIREAGIQE
jgi:tripartite-type tricarboxylate transporter receptor subunit TctC